MSDFARGDFRVGAVLKRTLSILISRFVLLGGMALASQVPVALFIVFLAGETVACQVGEEGSLWDQVLVMVGSGVSGNPSLDLASVGLLWLVLAAQTHGAIALLRESNSSIAACIATGLDRLLPTVAVVACGYAMVVLPIVATLSLGGPAGAEVSTFEITVAAVSIAAYAIFLALFVVVVPVVVVERLGVVAAFRRSFDLTRGNRLRILGIYLVLAVLAGTVVYLGEIAKASLLHGDTLKAGILIAVALYGVVATLFAVADAVIYHDLRLAKEGADSDEIAAVFD